MIVALYPNLHKTNALSCMRNVCDIFNRIGIKIFIDRKYFDVVGDKKGVCFGEFSEFIKECDVAVAIGGDGTIIKCSRQIIGMDKLLLGINSGRLGFMASLELSELDKLESLVSGDYTVTERMLLNAEYNGIEHPALNDIVISSMFSKLSEFEVMSGDVLVSKFRADGIIFSTPTGSTAYALSAGGPIIEPTLECVEMTPICPHTLFSRPMILSADRKLTITCSVKDSSDFFICPDGCEQIAMKSGDKISISRYEHKIKLINIRGNCFYNSVNKKILKPVK